MSGRRCLGILPVSYRHALAPDQYGRSAMRRRELEAANTSRHVVEAREVTPVDRQVVDVALRALSPGVNDPTTAADAIFHLCTVLVHVLTSPPAPRAYRGPQGRLVVTPEVMTNDDVADLAFGELRSAAATYPRVCVYLLEAMSLVIDALAASGAAARRTAPLRRQAELLVSAADEAIAQGHDRATFRAAFDKRFPPSGAFTEEAPVGRLRGRGADAGGA